MEELISTTQSEEEQITFLKEVPSKFHCDHCKKVMKDPQICHSCFSDFCKGCCINNSFCPLSGCKKVEVKPHTQIKDIISNLQIKCNICKESSPIIKFSEFDKHLEEKHKTPCIAKNLGCDFSDLKNRHYLHYLCCNFLGEYKQKERAKLLESFFLLGKNFLQEK
jgi:hypothetical protein